MGFDWIGVLGIKRLHLPDFWDMKSHEVKMAETRLRKVIIWGGVIVAMLAVIAIGFVTFRGHILPTRLVAHDWRTTLAAESVVLNECAECHEAQDYHGCDTCHDDHGAIEFAELPFYSLITLAGDVPEPGFVRIHEILPYQDHPETRIQLTDFLAGHGVTDFISVTLISDDGGFVTIEQTDLSDRAWLLPYEDGIRFACEDLHVSTWLKGITSLVVVQVETPLLIDGKSTSMGRLLLGPTMLYTVEQTEVRLVSEVDGFVRKASVASRIEGVPVEALIDLDAVSALQVQTTDGETTQVEEQAVRGAFLAQLRGEITLVLPDRGRSKWITGLTGIESVK
jgi:hypothetical protein